MGLRTVKTIINIRLLKCRLKLNQCFVSKCPLSSLPTSKYLKVQLFCCLISDFLLDKKVHANFAVGENHQKVASAEFTNFIFGNFRRIRFLKQVI